MTYNEKISQEYITKTRAVVSELPVFCADYFRYIANKNLSVRTRYAYALEVKNFLLYLIHESPEFTCASLPDFTLPDLRRVTADHIELYLEYCTLHESSGRFIKNNDKTRARKTAALRSFFKYYFKTGVTDKNAAGLVESPKLHEKAIVRLDVNEVADLLDNVEAGNGLTAKQQRYHKQTGLRDMAIISLFLGTGIRISELVGIDLNDIDLANRLFTVTRKGGNQDILSFGEEVYECLSDYAKQRSVIQALPGHENAFFLSLQRKRITVKAVENLVKKYASIAVPLKKITPHKLRSTFGTMLYRESGDIYLVADVLGHKDINTTRKHYAAQSEINKQNAAKMIHLREDD